MKKYDNRREFLQKLGAISLFTGAGSLIPLNSFGHTTLEDQSDNIPELKSLPPSGLFSVLDLSKPEMATVRSALEHKGHNAALAALLNYYRNRYPLTSGFSRPTSRGIEVSTFERADNLGKHIFQWGPYPAASYGTDIDWAADPAGDIEWIAGIYRFYWVTDLADAYKATGDERYARSFVELTSDWIRKHPLEDTIDKIHPIYDWKGYPWLDLQTGIRATNICSNFRILVHAKSFTPAFLGILLASLYDHQVKTEKMPMGKIHNKAIFEQCGFFNVLNTFPEFKDKDRWLNLAMGITFENLLAQTTTDGVQREWCGGYHSEVYSDALEIAGRVRSLGRNMPVDYLNRVQAMADHIFGISTPDLGFPMFGDTSRILPASKDRKTWQLYGLLENASRWFGDAKYLALADLNLSNLPDNGSIAFTGAGLYAMRNGWTPNQVYMALHCSPPSFNPWHDQPDNGTFELYAYGRWLMPDTGFYTYGHDQKAREWHRQTRVHPTLTLDGKDTDTIGRQLLWQSDEDTDIACVENQSYQYFLHRRTVWFSDKKSEMPFFVILDEANSDAQGKYELHFPLAPGPVRTDNEARTIITGFEETNLLIRIYGKHPVSLLKEEGWTSREYGEREPRTSVSAVYNGQGPLTFVSILVPYKGKITPDCHLLSDPATLIAGNNPIEIQVEVAGQKHILLRNVRY
jgi:heparan-sulfate lyase